MEDALLLIAEHLLSNPDDNMSLLAFVKLQATHPSVWLHYRNDVVVQKLLNSTYPRRNDYFICQQLLRNLERFKPASLNI
jgi:hypothetical protein